MPNEEIITSLRNAIERGENLQTAMQILINSGYNPSEVREASKFVGGALHLQEAKPEEHLTMPEQKSFFSKLAFWRKKKKLNLSKNPPLNPPKTGRISPPSNNLSKSAPANQEPALNKKNNLLTKKTRKKEIILLIILLILIGILVLTILFREKIIGWFS